MADYNVEYVFPFGGTDDGDDAVTDACMEEDLHSLCRKYEHLNFETFDLNEYKMHGFDKDIDPDNHFYSNMSNDCEYYTEEQFNSNITMKGALSLVHFNSRSIDKNFSKINP